MMIAYEWPTMSNFRFSIQQTVLNLNFSSRTSSMDVQRTIETSVKKRSKNIFGPPIGKKLAVFIDDMNMPIVDTYVSDYSMNSNRSEFL